MNKTLRVLALFSLILFVPAMASPAGPIDEDAIRAKIAASPSLKNAGDEEAIVLFEGDYLDFADGRTVWRHQELIRLYSEYAIDHLGDPRLAWDGSRQKLEIHANRTYLNDGSAQDAPSNAHNEVTPFGLDLAVDFMDIREVVVTRVGLERGVTIWLDYTIFDIEPGWLPYGRHFFFHGEFPVAERELVLRGLKGKSVNPPQAFAALDDPAEDGGLIWHAENLPPRPHDLNARRGDQLPWIAIFEAEDWKTLAGALADASSKSLSDLGDLQSELDALEEEHHPLGKEERLAMWMDWIASRVTRVRHGVLSWSRAPRTVAEVLDSATASELERTLLLLACMQSQDLPADLYFPARWRSLAEGPVAVDALQSPGLYLQSRKGKPLFIDGHTWQRDPRPEPRLQFSPDDPAAARWHKLWKMDDRVEMKAFWNLESGEGKAELSLFGPAAQREGLEQPQDLLSDWGAGWSEGAEASNVTITNLTPAILQGSLDIKASMPEADDDGFVILPLPMPPLSPGDFAPAGIVQAAREIAWLPDNALNFSCEWTVVLPEGWDVKLPEPLELPFANGSFSSKAEQKDRQVTFTYELSWNEESLQVEDWAAFRKAWLAATETSNQRIVFTEMQ
jgi:hypothetical protein